MKKIGLSALLALTLFWANLAIGEEASAAIASPSEWKNQRGSSLYIDSVSANGQITGRYVNRAPGFQCQNTPYPLTGWLYGTAITFTVKWDNSSASCNSLTAWTGFYNKGTIKTLWQLVRIGTTHTNQIMKGEDAFKQVAAQ